MEGFSNVPKTRMCVAIAISIVLHVLCKKCPELIWILLKHEMPETNQDKGNILCSRSV